MLKKSHIILLAILLLVVVVMWLANKQPGTETVVHQPNLVSKTDAQSAFEAKENAKIQPKKTQNDPIKTIEPSLKAVDESNERLYLDVYHDLQLAKECSYFYKENHQQKGQYDFLKVLNSAHSYRVGEDELAPEVQQLAFDRFIGSCLSLKDNVFKRARIIEEFPQFQFAYPVLVELRKELSAAIPLTKAEKELSIAIKLGERWKKQAMNLRNISLGDFKRSETERDVLQAESEALGEEIRLLYQNHPIDSNELSRLEKEIEQINELQFERLPASSEKLKQAQQSFEVINSECLKMAKLPNVDVFKEVMQRMHFSDDFNLKISTSNGNFMLNSYKKIVKVYAPPSDLIKNHANIVDSSVYDTLIKPAGFLYLCYLGDDCGPNSTYVREYCLDIDNHHNQMYVDACGKNLIDFFTEDYLTSNQWLDVSYLFDAMVDFYEN